MVQVKASEELMAVLGTLEGRAEVVDPPGAVVAYLVPAEGAAGQSRTKAISSCSAEEYRRSKERSEGDDRFTTEQVLDRLRAPGTS